MLDQILNAMQKYDHICPDIEEIRCSLCQERWNYEKRKLRHKKKRTSKHQKRPPHFDAL